MASGAARAHGLPSNGRPLMRSLYLAVLLALLCAAAAPHITLAVAVPGDYTSIQAALDAGATQILVAQGTYHETLLVVHDVQLLPAQPASWSDPVPVPRVDGMQIVGTMGMSNVYVRGFHFAGPVWLDGHDRSIYAALEACRVDGGFATSSAGLAVHLSVRNCLIFGDLYSHVYYPHIEDNVVIGGGITAWSNGGGWVTGNLVMGPAAVGIATPSNDVGSPVSHNTIRNVHDGIVAAMGEVDSNLVEDCSGTAYTSTNSARIEYNTTRHCGGNGITLGGYGRAMGNTVDSVALDGIHVSSSFAPVIGNTVSRSANHGIFASSYGAFIGNHVLRAGADGIHAESADQITGNVVGRCTGTGIVGPGLRHNTSYLNGGAGCRATNGYSDSLTHNVAYGNAGYGLVWSGTGTPVLGCNDWYGNAGGMVSGTSPGATDAPLNPLFCDLAMDDVSLSAASPLLDREGCGLVGALGQGCAEAVSVLPNVALLPPSFTVTPNPSGGSVRFAWPGPAAAGRLEVYDVTGALRWVRDITASEASLPWDGRDHEGRRLPAGMYYARLNRAGLVSSARFVLVQ
jgi:hypothetical protein